MKVNVRLFAAAKQFAGTDTIQLELATEATIASLRTALITAVPELSQLADSLRFAVDMDYASDETPVDANSDVACIPPVSGG